MKLAVILGSVREGRATDRLAKWVVNAAKGQTNVEVELVDLKDYEMPMFDEPGSPRYSPDRKPNAIAKKWLDKVAEFDAFVLVTPEYNRSTSGVLKNALDYLDFQMEKKPVALVGHGSTGGAQAVSHLRSILPGLGAITVPQALYFAHHVGEAISEDGELGIELKDSPYGPQVRLSAMIDNLVWYSDALAAARAKG